MRRARGFSFLEMLVVLVLIALISALAIAQLGIGSGTRELNQQALRLQQVLLQMCDQAASEAKLYGLKLASDGYEVQSPETPLPPADGSAWQWLAAKQLPAFLAYELPEQLSLSLYRDAETINFSTDSQSAPQIICLDRYNWPAFQIALRAKQASTQDGKVDQRWIWPNAAGALQLSESAP